jgi:hypothetical protein
MVDCGFGCKTNFIGWEEMSINDKYYRCYNHHKVVHQISPSNDEIIDSLIKINRAFGLVSICDMQCHNSSIPSNWTDMHHNSKILMYNMHLFTHHHFVLTYMDQYMDQFINEINELVSRLVQKKAKKKKLNNSVYNFYYKMLLHDYSERNKPESFLYGLPVAFIAYLDRYKNFCDVLEFKAALWKLFVNLGSQNQD